jgi:Predicted Zn-dependent protease (DUF2268)
MVQRDYSSAPVRAENEELRKQPEAAYGLVYPVYRPARVEPRHVARDGPAGAAMVRIENICPDFFAFWERAEGRACDEKVDLWHTLYEDRHRDIFDVYYGAYGRSDRLGDALDRFPHAVPIMRAAMSTAEECIARTVPRAAQLFADPEGDVPYVLMVGLFQSDAWATSLRGQPTSFLTLEHVASPRQLEITVAHEAAHTLHHRSALPPLHDWVHGGSVAEGLFSEGLAVLASARLVPGATDAEYLNNHGPDGPAWLAACARQWGEIRQRLLGEIEQVDPAHFRAYFAANKATAAQAELPVRAGYVAGYYILRALNRQHTVAEMARWPVTRIVAEVQEVLEMMDLLPVLDG